MLLVKIGAETQRLVQEDLARWEAERVRAPQAQQAQQDLSSGSNVIRLPAVHPRCRPPGGAGEEEGV
jgi:hypothetical protein